MTSLSVSRIDLELNWPWIDPPLFPPDHYEFTICFLFHYKYIIFFATSLIFSEFTLTPLSFLLETTLNSLWNHYETTLKSLWINYLLSDFLNHFLFREHFEITICFSISLWIHYLFREFSVSSLSYSRNHY